MVKKYVGKHSSRNLSKDRYIGSGVLLTRAIKKYGRENFTFKILRKYKDEEEAYEYEKYFVIFYDTLNNGYNLKDGGRGGMSGYVYSQETLEKIRLALLGKRDGVDNPNYGSGNFYDVYKNNIKIANNITPYDVEELIGISKNNVINYARRKSKYRNMFLITFHVV